MRADGKIFIRALYLFDDRIADRYNTEACTTFDSVYENMPIVDTWYQRGDSDGGYGMLLDETDERFTAYKSGDDELAVAWGDKKIIFAEDRIILDNCKVSFAYTMVNTDISTDKSNIFYKYKGNNYSLSVLGAEVKENGRVINFEGKRVTLIPTKS